VPQSRCPGVIPGQEFIDPGVCMAVDDGGKGIGHPGVGIDSIELAGFNQGSDDGPVWRPGIVAFEEGVFRLSAIGRLPRRRATAL